MRKRNLSRRAGRINSMIHNACLEGLENRCLLSASIAVLGEQDFSTALTDGSTSTSTTLGTDLGTVATNLPAGSIMSHAYYLVNEGSSDLTIGTVTLTGDTTDFAVDGAPTSPVTAPTSTTPSYTTLIIGFQPVSGSHSVVVHIPTNDPSHPNFSFTISATGGVIGTFGTNVAYQTVANSGTVYTTTTAGTGRAAVNGDILQMRYTGYLPDGTVFDSNVTSATSLGFIIGHQTNGNFDLIHGWELGLVGVKQGESRTLYIPQAEGYGTTGSGASIPGYASLIFTVTVDKLIGPDFVPNLYHDILGRASDASGLASWTNQLAPYSAGQSTPPTLLTPAQVTASFISSTEYRTNRITALYSSVLGRAPDSSGLNSWLNYLAQGNTVELMAAQFYGSPEFANQHGNTVNGEVTGLYQVLLKRTPDQAGLNYWVGKVNGGQTISQIAYSMLRAPEGLSVSVTNIYVTYLHRQPDSAGLSYWTGKLGQTNGSETDILSGVMSAPEYYSA